MPQGPAVCPHPRCLCPCCQGPGPRKAPGRCRAGPPAPPRARLFPRGVVLTARQKLPPALTSPSNPDCRALLTRPRVPVRGWGAGPSSSWGASPSLARPPNTRRRRLRSTARLSRATAHKNHQLPGKIQARQSRQRRRPGPQPKKEQDQSGGQKLGQQQGRTEKKPEQWWRGHKGLYPLGLHAGRALKTTSGRGFCGAAPKSRVYCTRSAPGCCGSRSKSIIRPCSQT